MKPLKISIANRCEDHWTKSTAEVFGNIGFYLMPLSVISGIIGFVFGFVIGILGMYIFLIGSFAFLLIGATFEHLYERYCEKRKKESVVNFARRLK